MLSAVLYIVKNIQKKSFFVTDIENVNEASFGCTKLTAVNQSINRSPLEFMYFYVNLFFILLQNALQNVGCSLFQFGPV